MNIAQELTDNQTLLLLVPSAGYNAQAMETARQLSGKSLCYVTLNKTSAALKEAFGKNAIPLKNIVFIDAISKTFKASPEQDENTYFVSSPGALTELSLTISRVLRHGFDYLIFDSLTNLLVYEKRAPVAKFLSDLVNKVRASKTRAVFYALSIQEQSTLLQECGMFVDKVIDASTQ